jgi:hypothetical protein
MGILIYLPSRPEAPRSEAVTSPNAAQILFFTGVRYMRHEEPQSLDTVRRKAARPDVATIATRGAHSDTPRTRRRRG